jgi:hypothetical protein
MKTYNEQRQLGLEYHDTLNPKLWNSDDTLKPEVRSHLLSIAEQWRIFSHIPSEAVTDVVLSGGNVNYNYTPLSDIDVHLRCDFTKMPMVDPEIMKDYIFSKMALWSIKHPITVYGYPVQLFAQDVADETQTPVNQGVYSLTNNSWVLKPNNLHINYDNDLMLKDKVDYYIKLIDNIIDTDAPIETANKLRNKLSDMRAESLHKAGEFGEGNNLYKEIRNQGYLQKLANFANGKEDNGLSLN